MDKHTPGPWVVKRASEPEESTEFYFTSDKGVIGYWKGGRHRHTDDQWLLTEADANLIAAAPELLKALDGMLKIYGCHYDRDGLKPSTEIECITQAIEAIARARGEA
jgi:hypothetical protein